ncbi:transglutaminase-like domain-containing protein [Blastopirellula marina]|nr:transglutaminase-like domain-containing protein [Blastopirellula marina]
MRIVRMGLGSFILSILLAAGVVAAEPDESLFRDLPPGVFLIDNTIISDSQSDKISQKLGGNIVRLNNARLTVHGRSIQINIITADTAGSSERILATLQRNKLPPFCFRTGKTVIEYVGKDIDEALARKTSYELRLIEKPPQITYQVEALLATIDQADYMACNPLFQRFLAFNKNQSPETSQQIQQLAEKFVFGHELALRNPSCNAGAATYRLTPAPQQQKSSGAVIRFSFSDLPQQVGVPYVTTNIQIVVNHEGVFPTAEVPGKELTTPTHFWPSDDADIRTLALQITQGKQSNGAKAMAILEWLAPGKNIRYGGQVGSRWGTAKVLKQRYGHCWDFSDCFVTLARAAGVPSRQVGGWLYGASGHVWAEFYREGVGWQQVDPTGGGKLRCGLYHIPYFTTEDGAMPIVYLAMPKIEIVSDQQPNPIPQR